MSRAFCVGRRVGDEGLGRGTSFLNGIVQIINTLTPAPLPQKSIVGEGRVHILSRRTLVLECVTTGPS
jgi:hypothetical protein